MTNIIWDCFPFSSFDAELLYQVLALRQSVFVVEQQSAYLDADGYDQAAQHLIGRREMLGQSALLVCYARLLLPQTKYPEWSIGRVVVDKAARGQGLGRTIMVKALQRIASLDAEAPVRVQAQSYLANGFYAQLGFVTCTDEYVEDGIPHVEMLRRPST